MPRGDVPRYLKGAGLLALARPFSLRSQAGFSTKLGEYLATGNPIVVTVTGEIANYLQDRVNVYLSPPDDVGSFAKCLREALSSPDDARGVGQRGREVALTHFDFHSHGVRLHEFINICILNHES